MANLITKELLESKLRQWTLSSQVHKVLGFTDEQESAVKAELNTLAELGVVDKDGARRGLKFRLAGIVDEPTSEDTTEGGDDDYADEDRSVRGYKAVKQQNIAATKDKSLYELIQWVIAADTTKDPYLTSMTLALKKKSDGDIDVIAYAGITRLVEHTFSPTEFVKFVNKSIAPKESK